ncbi:RHS repeat domain-containing protein [Pseudomonas fragi]|uniref:RHS repeat domain-containing protein n=1 Tax=Pseudomonas fragi TaxID=296 RepID=UPI003917D137
MSYQLHQKTPVLTSMDGRGAMLRTVAYHRVAADGPTSTRATLQRYDARGHRVEQWDPRLSALAETDTQVMANQKTCFSLSGQALRNESVDAGWRLTLYNAAKQTAFRWDGRGTSSRCDFDEQLRPVALFEIAKGQTDERCDEYFVYAATGPDDARRNRCGRVLRHDDPAGSLWHESFAVSGQPLIETRRFCTALTAPDWPDAPLQTERYTTRWRYNALGVVIGQTDAAGHVRTFDVDIAGRCSASQLDGVAVLKSCEYNAFDQVYREQAGNNVLTIARYSPVNGQLLSLKATTGTGHLLQDLHYQYDPASNIERIQDQAQPVQWFAQQRIEAVNTYRYDTLYQLIGATGRENASQRIGPGLPGLELFASRDDSRWRNYSQTYSYDSGANLTSLKHDAGAGNTSLRQMVVAERSNRSLFKGEVPVDFASGFDANGNQQALAPGQLMHWNTRNQLHQVTQVVREEPDGQDDDVETYIYDGTGQRVRKVRRAKTGGGEQVIEVLYLPGLEIRTPTTGEQLHVVTTQAGRNQVRVLHWATEPDQWRYSLGDHLGSSTLELDHAGELISQESYYPYGGTSWWAARSAVQARYKTLRYSGKERDATGLYYYGARYYAPWLQRWINPDPAGTVDGLNLYRMLCNNPLRFVDEDGNQPKEVSDAYSHMVKKGEAWEDLRSQGEPFSAVKTLSGENLANLRQNLELSPAESQFVQGFQDELFDIVHFSNKDFRDSEGSLTLLSSKQLTKNKISFNRNNTDLLDLDSFATNDFVFFSLEAGVKGRKEKSRFGEHRFRAPMGSLKERHDYTHVELMDLAQVDQRPGTNKPSWVAREDQEIFFRSAESNTILSSVFVGKDMIEGMALRIVGELQNFGSDTKDSAFALQTSGQVSEVMNSLFRPQIVVPHSLTISKTHLSYKGPAPKAASTSSVPVVTHFYV